MSIPTVYQKSISNDFSNGKVNVSQLVAEITSSPITVALDTINTEGDQMYIIFKNPLSPTEETILNNLIVNHQAIQTKPITAVKIVEESNATGGNFSTRTLTIDSTGGSSTSIIISWPYPITCLAVKFVPTSSQVNDLLDIAVAPGVTTGVITSNIVPAEEWEEKNYQPGDKVIFTHPIYGSRVYTNIVATVANESPLEKAFWVHGFQIDVSPTVIQTVYVGYYLKVTDGVNSFELGRVLSKLNSSILVEINPTVSFSATSPTYIQQTIYMMKDYLLALDKLQEIGSSKIGGSYIPADVPVVVKYTNNGTENQHFVGAIEYLY